MSGKGSRARRVEATRRAYADVYRLRGAEMPPPPFGNERQDRIYAQQYANYRRSYWHMERVLAELAEAYGYPATRVPLNELLGVAADTDTMRDVYMTRAQREAYERILKNAERYRWLREYNTERHKEVTEAFFLGDENLDAAIDAAMRLEASQRRASDELGIKTPNTEYPPLPP